ncbi:MAG TPA: flavodoxin [Bacteroides sp.]|nr:flavodoxin [Bacteroides sp.]
MKKIGIVYSFNTNKTSKIAKRIADAVEGTAKVEMINVEEITAEQFQKFDNLICGTATWFDGELPNHWDEFVPDIEDMDLKGKNIAIFGLGDQKGYPENFLDGMGILAEILEAQGARIVGFTSNEGYNYESSRAEKGDQFCGLGIDYESQGSKNKERVNAWVKKLKMEFK